jgi:DNA-binding CsgD family transcriptional regulator
MPDELQMGRESYRRRAWGDAYDSLSHADRATPLGADDLELFAAAAYLTGRELEFHGALDRAHHAHLDAGDRVRAARCAFWSGLNLLLRGDTAQATGWLGRARRLVEGDDCVERGYLLLPVAEQRLGEGNDAGAHAAAVGAAEIGDRFRDADLIACARHVQGRVLIHEGKVEAGLALLDEAMLAVVTGELAPIMTGLIYCSVIDACQEIQAVRHAREWTTALARWCEQQPQMVAFTSTCLVHRAEVMQLSGAWADAMAEACRACERFSQGLERNPPAAAFYRRAELHRLRGELAAADEAYLTASRLGREPQPGLALLRLAQGRNEAASAAIRRVVSATTDPLQRARLLPAHVEIMLAVGDLDEARSACRALEESAATFDTEVLRALAAQARGALAVAERDAQAAVDALRRAFELWQRVEAPYEAARVRVLMGLACRSLGDDEAGDLELGAARAVFERLGAAPDLARLDSIRERSASARRPPLTPRELQVLRRVAAGKTNKVIAAELFLSERTIDRHVSNIFRKLNVHSRAAATAHAYDRKLL